MGRLAEGTVKTVPSGRRVGRGFGGSGEGKIEANFRIRGLVVREQIIKPEAEFNKEASLDEEEATGVRERDAELGEICKCFGSFSIYCYINALGCNSHLCKIKE